jgi:hypothetical protein
LEKNLQYFHLISPQMQLECKSVENISATQQPPPKMGAGSRGLAAAECGRGASLNLRTNFGAKIGSL